MNDYNLKAELVRILSSWFGFLTACSLQDWSYICSIGAGLITIIYTIMQMISLNKKKPKKEK